MAPFMLDDSSGKQHVNIIRIVEVILSGFIVSAVVLYGNTLVMAEKVEAIKGIVNSHVEADVAARRELAEKFLEHHEILVRHDTVLRQKEYIK